MLAFLLGLPLATLVAAHPAHEHRRTLPEGDWFQPDNHPAKALFPRSDNILAAMGTPEWYGQYPQAGPQVASSVPQAWKDALANAIKAGKIPSDVPVSMATGGNPTYPGNDPSSPAICSSTYKQCRNPEDIWDAPDGTLGTGFDDGPTPESDQLYDFLKANNQSATHFFIGINILNNPKQFTRAFSELGNPIALHTWSHKYMTTLSNDELLGEFGWTMKIISDSTGGRLPKYWRPPYGDSDNRVRAIAMQVFGLTTIIWNQDTEDWRLTSGGTTPETIHNSMVKWLIGPKSPGLVILEHELSVASVQAFIDAYPLMKSNGWKLDAITSLQGGSPWQNADDNFSAVTPLQVVAGPDDEADSSDDSASSGSGSSLVSGSASKSDSSAPTATKSVASTGNPASTMASGTASLQTVDSFQASSAAAWEPIWLLLLVASAFAVTMT